MVRSVIQRLLDRRWRRPPQAARLQGASPIRLRSDYTTGPGCPKRASALPPVRCSPRTAYPSIRNPRSSASVGCSSIHRWHPQCINIRFDASHVPPRPRASRCDNVNRPAGDTSQLPSGPRHSLYPQTRQRSSSRARTSSNRPTGHAPDTASRASLRRVGARPLTGPPRARGTARLRPDVRRGIGERRKLRSLPAGAGS